MKLQALQGPFVGGKGIAFLLLCFVAIFAQLGCGGGDGGSTPAVDAPTITTQPTSRTLLGGESTTFSVVATGSDLQYQWYFNGGPISGATSSSVTVTNASAAKAGPYYVVVSNPGGSVTSSTATLVFNTSTGDGEVIVQ